MPITNAVEWNKAVEVNSKPYGKACIDVAREVMRLLDERDGAIDCHALISEADKATYAGGITGFMAGCVAQMVGAWHSRGDEFRQAWNKGYGVDEIKAKGGTVNPAIVTIETP